MSKKITMQQIANYLGVSKFVVSKALSGKGGVSEETKEKVIEAAIKLGYITPRTKLKASKSTASTSSLKQTVIVLMPNIRFQTKESLYWGRIVDGISQELDARGLGMIILSEQNIESLAHFINPKGVLGMIGVGEISSAMLLEIQRIGMTTVLVDHEDDLVKLDTIFADNFEATKHLTKQFIGLGKTEIAFVGDVRYSRSFLDRFLGYRSAIEDYEMQHNKAQPWLRDSLINLDGIVEGEFSEQIDQWISQLNKLPHVLMCGNDDIALTVMGLLSQRGIAVPDDVYVTGFDNINASYEASIPLTTVDVPKEVLGKKAVDRLLERLQFNDEPTMKILIKSEIVFRSSTSLA